jgi:ABC-type nitrate/sulfonate/bicarbonate transport system substrate-binding protein
MIRAVRTNAIKRNGAQGDEMSRRRAGYVMGAVLAAVLAVLGPSRAAEHVKAGNQGGQAPLWPFYIAENKGFFAAEGIDLDVTFARSPAQVIQQLTAGSIDVAISVAADGPVQAIDKGASLAIVRIIGDRPPYALIAKPAIRTLADLRGKTIASGSSVDITDVYLKRMLAAAGLKPGDYDTLAGGVAATRYAALQAGSADAALILPPLNFRAEKAGFHTVALAADYVHDFPFAVMAVLRPWAQAHKDTVRRILKATDKSIAWFKDPSNRAAAIAVLVKVGKANRDDAEASYDYLRHIDYFALSAAVPREKLQSLIAMDRERGLVGKTMTVDRLVLKEVTDLTQ